MTADILVEREGAVMRLRFNRPDKKNAITSAMYAALAEALEEAQADGAVRAVTLTGEGDSFTSGNDLKDFMAAASGGGDDLPVYRFLRILSGFAKPIVAGVQGNAIGIGTTLLLHCDLVAAAPDARFSLPFVDLALVPEAASSMLLPRLIGPQLAAKHLMLAEPFGAEEALRYGLVAEVARDVDAAVTAMAARLAAKPPEALRIAKALIRADAEPVEARIAREGKAFGERLQSAEAAEAFRAFFEKRAPNFG